MPKTALHRLAPRFARHAVSAVGLAFLACSAAPNPSGGASPPPSGTGGTAGASGGTGGSRSGGSTGNPGSGGNVATGSGGTSSGGATGSGGAASPSGTGGNASNAGNGGTAGDAASTDSASPPASDPPAGPPGTTDVTKFRYSRPLTLDTTAAGAGVTADVAGYPVAVKLPTDFDFTQAKPDGADVRFATTDGKPLPYAIELWDPAKKEAALWVLVDLKGNATQTINLHWGNAEATSAANSAAVFPKTGFLGVYHLDQDGNTTEGGYKDASANQVHGTGVKLAPGSREPARVGYGTRLDNPKGGAAGEIRWIEVAGDKVIKDFGSEEHPISISAWAYANTWDGYYQTIFSKGDGSYSLQKDYMGRTEVCMSPLTGTNHQCAITAAPPTKIWTHYMVMRKNAPYAANDLVLYINGKRAASTGAGGKHIALPFGIGNQSLRGRERDLKGFNGILDEVRVMPVERSADWAKLDYESQREGAKFVTFGAVKAL